MGMSCGLMWPMGWDSARRTETLTYGASAFWHPKFCAGRVDVAVFAAISCYKAVLDQVRDLVGADQFIEVFVDTPLSACADRDPKGCMRGPDKKR